MDEKVQEFDNAYKLFTSSDDPLEYRRSVEILLAKIGLKSKFKHELQDFLGLSNKRNFEEYTINDLYEKKLLPNEIFLQFFYTLNLSK